jgi:hypothetical protein
LVVFDGDGFILQVHGVFTRIRSGATVVATYEATMARTDLQSSQWRQCALAVIPG